uniref:SAYSvFN domain-containing protein 1 n=1 Tax=Bactrocera latifrons TaxID=174628 RepID=A0A0K8TUX9_BACLA
MAEELRNKLYKYRFEKQRQNLIQIFKSKFRDFWMMGMGQRSLCEVEQIGINVINSNAEFTESVEYAFSQNSDDEDERESVSEVKSSSDRFSYVLSVVVLLFWITLYVIAIKLQFGTVYLMISALMGIYLNTRSTPKITNEISAYSVFNKNCKSIDGTLKAEQFEQEIRYGSLRKN